MLDVPLASSSPRRRAAPPWPPPKTPRPPLILPWPRTLILAVMLEAIAMVSAFPFVGADLHQRFGSFAWTGALSSVTYTPGPDAPDAPSTMVDMLRDIGRAFE